MLLWLQRGDGLVSITVVTDYREGMGWLVLLWLQKGEGLVSVTVVTERGGAG